MKRHSQETQSRDTVKRHSQEWARRARGGSGITARISFSHVSAFPGFTRDGSAGDGRLRAGTTVATQASVRSQALEEDQDMAPRPFRQRDPAYDSDAEIIELASMAVLPRRGVALISVTMRVNTPAALQRCQQVAWRGQHIRDSGMAIRAMAQLAASRLVWSGDRVQVIGCVLRVTS